MEHIALPILVAVVCLTTITCATDAPEQIHLSLGSDERQMIVTWVSQGRRPTISAVTFGPLNDVSKRMAYGNWSALHPGGDRLIYIHRVILSDLEPGTTYEYAVKAQNTSNKWSKSYTFETRRPGSSEAFIAIYGDMGLVDAKILPSLTSLAEGNKLDAIFHVGDMAYDVQDREGQVGDDFMNMIQEISAHVPYQILPGNHEEHDNFTHYDHLFTMMDSGSGVKNNFYHSTNIGPLHVVSITDDFYFFTGYGTGQLVSQYNWLVNDLKEANKPENRMIRPWIILLSHRPMYSSTGLPDVMVEMETVRNGIDGKYGLEQVLNDNRIDLFIAGHVHNYERMLPMYMGRMQEDKPDPYHDAEYPVHLITGAAGNQDGLTPFLLPRPRHSVKRITDYGYTTMNASLSRLLIQQISKDGQVVDRFEMSKSLSSPHPKNQ